MSTDIPEATPGEILARVLRERGMAPADLCNHPGRLPLEVVNGIIDGTTPITADVAIRLSSATGVPSSFWRDREYIYRRDLKRGAES